MEILENIFKSMISHSPFELSQETPALNYKAAMVGVQDRLNNLNLLGLFESLILKLREAISLILVSHFSLARLKVKGNPRKEFLDLHGLDLENGESEIPKYTIVVSSFFGPEDSRNDSIVVRARLAAIEILRLYSQSRLDEDDILKTNYLNLAEELISFGATDTCN